MYSPPSTPSTPSEPSMYLLPSTSTLQATSSEPSNPSTSTDSETDHPPRRSARIASHPPPIIDVDDSDDDVAPQQPVNLSQPIRNQSAVMWQANLTRMMRSSHPDALETDAVNINALTERDAAQALIQCLLSHFLNDPLSADAFPAGVRVVVFNFEKLCYGRRRFHVYVSFTIHMYSSMLTFTLVGRLWVLALSEPCFGLLSA